MALTIASAILTVLYIALLVGGAIAHHGQRFDLFVRLNVVALVVTITLALANFAWGDDILTPAIWTFNTALQVFGVWQARKYRREWLSWQDPHSRYGHVCNEDCPDWTVYHGSGLR